jgi:TatD DNase family protein
MKFIDTHAHLYAPEFDADRAQILQRALEAGVEIMLLPNIDEESVKPMHQICAAYPQQCYPMMGLHPSSVKENYEAVLAHFKSLLDQNPYIAVGEIGIDLYWDQSFVEQQKLAFKEQLRWAEQKQLPVVIHSREAHEVIIQCIDELNISTLRGVFHCFTGSLQEAHQIIERGFKLGIGGVLTFKNSKLPEVISQLDVSHLLLETDAPYLSPAPHRGQRNESAYIPLVAQRLAEIKGLKPEILAAQLWENTHQLFNLNS